MFRLMVVEDDPVISRKVAEFLALWGYEVRCVEDFNDIMPDFTAFDPHLVLLDLKLPVLGGYHWCREIRRQSSVPILFITSAGDSMTAVTAMSLGADDLIAKPFDLSVLGAKIEALLRRAYAYPAAPATYDLHGIAYDPAAGELRFGAHTAALTRNENRILHTLTAHRGSFVSREKLMTALWETDEYIDDNTLTVNVLRLRRKLGQWGHQDIILTRKGMGYMVKP
ncbi:MAG: response regulator transcription factor [Clostridiales bacterium]|nr:response regulator transcription factor [Clostridiales bacterium]